MIAAFQHLIGTVGGDYLSLVSMFADQQIGSTPDVAVRDHSGSSRQAEFLPLDDPNSVVRKVLIVPRR
jgi:hypothetical protein